MTEAEKSIKIVIVEDHPAMRKGLKSIFEAMELPIEIIGETSSVKGAKRLISTLKPNIAWVDLAISEGSGFDIAQWLISSDINCKIIIFTNYSDESYLEYAIDLGVDGYLLKEDNPSTLLDCIRSVLRGKKYITGSLANVEPIIVPNSGAENLEKCSLAQLQVLHELSNGLTSKEIARLLGISYRTVQNHRFDVGKRLSLHGTNRLLSFSIKNKDHIYKRIQSCLLTK